MAGLAAGFGGFSQILGNCDLGDFAKCRQPFRQIKEKFMM
jgi:hypothetical protein